MCSKRCAKAGPAHPLVPRADVVPDVHRGHHRRARVTRKDDPQAVIQPVEVARTDLRYHDIVYASAVAAVATAVLARNGPPAARNAKREPAPYVYAFSSRSTHVETGGERAAEHGVQPRGAGNSRQCGAAGRAARRGSRTATRRAGRMWTTRGGRRVRRRCARRCGAPRTSMAECVARARQQRVRIDVADGDEERVAHVCVRAIERRDSRRA
jgi:hypothetical protein